MRVHSEIICPFLSGPVAGSNPEPGRTMVHIELCKGPKCAAWVETTSHGQCALMGETAPIYARATRD